MQTHVPAPAPATTEQTRQQQHQPEYETDSAQLLRTPQFEDGRPEVTAQLHQQSLMANSPRTTQLKAMQAMMANSPRVSQLQTTQAMMAASPRVQQLKTTQSFIAAGTLAKQNHQTSAAPVTQRMEDEESLQSMAEDPVQREQTEASATDPTSQDAPPSEAPKPNNTGLPDQLKTGIENLSGISMDHVKVHYNSDKPAQLQAHAYAQGSDIHVAPGQEQHLPHEAWHVVQQAQGRVKPTVQMKGGVEVNDDVGLESEADLMGAKAWGLGAVQMHTEGNVGMLELTPSLLRKAMMNNSAQAMQRKALQERIDNSPLMGAQRMQHDKYAPIQRRLELNTGEVITGVEANVGEEIDLKTIQKLIESSDTYMLANMEKVKELATGNRVDVLTPHRHIIGETHSESQFNQAKEDWPKAPAMEEGRHDVEETALDLPKGTRGEKVMTDVVNQTREAILPLENYHAASSLKLALFLVAWNEYCLTGSEKMKDLLFNRFIAETTSIINIYTVLASEVVTKGHRNMAWYKFSPVFKSNVEKEYAALFEIINNGKVANLKLNYYNEAVKKQQFPHIDAQSYELIRKYIATILKPVGKILKVSNALGSKIVGIDQGVDAFLLYMESKDNKVVGEHIPNILGTANVARELHMARNIGSLAQPGLVKVGSAHLENLKGQSINKAIYYQSYLDFRLESSKGQEDLT